MHVLPNGDVLVAESMGESGKPSSLFDHAMSVTMKRARASGDSPNRITLLRDADGDGVAEIRHAFIENVRQPFGMVLIGDTLYVGASDAVLAYPYEPGATSITAPGKQADEPQARRPLDAQSHRQQGRHQALCRRRFAEQYRRCRHGSRNRPRLHPSNSTSPPASRASLPAACAIRSAWPGSRRTGRLCTVVNERDGLGDETPPDYLTSVRDGGFYGWPYSYWGDRRRPRAAGRRHSSPSPQDHPDYALGGHTASLGLCWLPEGTLPGFPPAWPSASTARGTAAS